MRIIEDAQLLTNNVKEKVTDMLNLCVEAVTGNQLATIKLMYLIGKETFSIPDRLFYAKLDLFLKGIMLDDDDCATMRRFLASKGDIDEHGFQILTHINNALSKTKVKFITNATRFAQAYGLTLPVYFRICCAVNIVMEDDLQFLADNIKVIDDLNANHFAVNQHTHMLFSIGAMRIITTIWRNGEYAFTPFARLLDASTISFDNDARYPNPRRVVEEFEEQED